MMCAGAGRFQMLRAALVCVSLTFVTGCAGLGDLLALAGGAGPAAPVPALPGPLDGAGPVAVAPGAPAVQPPVVPAPAGPQAQPPPAQPPDPRNVDLGRGSGDDGQLVPGGAPLAPLSGRPLTGLIPLPPTLASGPTVPPAPGL
jgi:hypothetical protein